MCDIITNLIKQYKLGELSKRDFLCEAVMKMIESEKGEVILIYDFGDINRLEGFRRYVVTKL